MNRMSYAQAARWLVFTHSFDDTAFKPQGKDKNGEKLPSAKVGWLGQLGLIYIVGANLFETLLLNLVVINRDNIENNQMPIWEMESVRFDERVKIPFPNNLAELYTLQSRRIHLFRENGDITHFHVLAGDLISEERAFKEPMTVWKQKKDTYVPQNHDYAQQMWREFSVLYQTKELENSKDKNQMAGIIKWYLKYLLPYFSMKNKRHMIETAIVGLEYDTSASHKFLNYFYDSLTMHADLLSDLGADWRSKIETELDRCGKIANAIAFLAQNLYVASGGSNSKKDKHFSEIPSVVKSQLYYRLDVPFRKWLRSIKPDIKDEKLKDEKQSEWQNIARRIAENYANELMSETDESAIVGHVEEGKLYSSPRAILIFRKQLNKIYGKV